MGYQFIPWVKNGTGAAVSMTETLGDDLAASISLPVTLRINNRHEASVSVGLFGPGDIAGIDQRQILRVEPRHLATDFEPNYFPVVEFRRADFPWMFTPAIGDGRGRLRPWLCLIAVRAQEGVQFTVRRNVKVPVLTIGPPAVPANELPDLGDSWAWAHAQVLGEHKGTALRDALSAESQLALSRLLCPVRLVENSRYHACLVPAFEAGRKAGLGFDAGPEDATLRPAWRSGAARPTSIELPVYFQWEFATGRGGDFESLVRQLHGTSIPSGVGRREMEVAGLGFGLPDLAGVSFEGALRAIDAAGPPADSPHIAAFKERLRAILNAAAIIGADADPIVAPPIYGSYHAAARQVPAPNADPVWLADLNLDPRSRAVASLGALVVQDQQELLMASAWEQLAGVDRALQSNRLAELAREVGKKSLVKHFATMGEARLFEVTLPVHSRVRFASGSQPALATADTTTRAAPVRTLGAQLQAANLPRGMTTAAFRTTFRPGGPMSRRAAAASPASGKPVAERLVERTVDPPATGPGTIVQGLVTVEQIKGQLTRLRELLGPNPLTSQSSRFLSAAEPLVAYLERPVPVSLLPRPNAPPLAEIKQGLLAQLDPAHTVERRAEARVPAPAFRADARSAAVQEAAPLPHPEFPQPMYAALRDLSQEFLLPGAENVPLDTVSLVETNTRFVESFMVGLNHEMSRELLWREYPTDQRGTYFARFWDTAGRSRDSSQVRIADIHLWDARAALGQTFPGHQASDQLVLLIRAEVLRRYPGTIIYGVRADTLDQPQPVESHPIFRGTLESDIVFLGFDLTEAQARGGAGQPGYYFILQEQPAEPRFGLDVPTAFGAAVEQLTSWAQLTWGHVVEDADAFDRLRHVSLAGRLSGRRLEAAEWGFNSAHMARITLQKRVRVAIHASELLPSPKSRIDR